MSLTMNTPDVFSSYSPLIHINMITARSSERNKIFSSLNVFISLDGKCPIIHCKALLEVHCWSIQLSAAQFCSSFCAWCLAATAKPCKARSRVTTCTLCVVGWCGWWDLELQNLVWLVGWLVWLVGWLVWQGLQNLVWLVVLAGQD